MLLTDQLQDILFSVHLHSTKSTKVIFLNYLIFSFPRRYSNEKPKEGLSFSQSLGQVQQGSLRKCPNLHQPLIMQDRSKDYQNSKQGREINYSWGTRQGQERMLQHLMRILSSSLSNCRLAFSWFSCNWSFWFRSSRFSFLLSSCKDLGAKAGETERRFPWPRSTPSPQTALVTTFMIEYICFSSCRIWATCCRTASCRCNMLLRCSSGLLEISSWNLTRCFFSLCSWRNGKGNEQGFVTDKSCSKVK